MSEKSSDAVVFRSSPEEGLIAEKGDNTFRIGPHLDVTAKAVEERTHDNHLEIEFMNDDKLMTILHPVEDVVSPHAMLKAIAKKGYELPTERKHQRLLLQYLAESRPTGRSIITERSGYHGDHYVLCDGTVIPEQPETRIVFRSNAYTPPGGPCAGSLQGWIAGVGEPARRSRRMMFVIGASISALVLKHTGVESGVFHLYGPTSAGKTLSQLVALSIHEPVSRARLSHWNHTHTALEELAAAHCDRLLVLDESGHLSTESGKAIEKTRQAAYTLTAGRGRYRAQKVHEHYRPTEWRLVGLSSGEFPISSLTKNAGAERFDGERLRLIDVPLSASAEYGVFESVPDDTASGKFAAEIEKSCERNGGHFSAAFVVKLLESRKDKTLDDRIRRYMSDFVEKAKVPSMSLDQRFAKRFALAYTAARLAVKFGLLPWSLEEIQAAFVEAYDASKSAVFMTSPGVASVEAVIARRLRKSKNIVKLRGSRRVSSKELARASAFYKKDEQLGRIYVIKRRTLERWCGPGMSLTEIAAHLSNRGFLLRDKRGNSTRQVKVKGIRGRRRYYCVRHQIRHVRAGN